MQQFHNNGLICVNSLRCFDRERMNIYIYICRFINALLTHSATHIARKEELHPVTVTRSLRPAYKHVGEINRLTAREAWLKCRKNF